MTGSLGQTDVEHAQPSSTYAERRLHLGRGKGRPYIYHTPVSCSCPEHEARHTVPVLLHQASLLAQLPCYHSTQPSSALEHSRNQKSPQQVLLAVTARLSGMPNLYLRLVSIARLVIASAGCPKGSQQSKSQQSQPMFARAQPTCLGEWDHVRNIDEA